MYKLSFKLLVKLQQQQQRYAGNPIETPLAEVVSCCVMSCSLVTGLLGMQRSATSARSTNRITGKFELLSLLFWPQAGLGAKPQNHKTPKPQNHTLELHIKCLIHF